MSPSDKVTYSDLLSMKNEITKEQTEYRHDDRRKMQEALIVLDDIKEERLLSNHIIENMQKDIQEIKTTLNTLVDKLDGRYASKWTEKVMIFIASTAWAILIGAFMYLVIKQ